MRLAEPGDPMRNGEGIETCLAAMQETGFPAWAALSTFWLRVLDLPKSVRDVIVLTDGDDPGESRSASAYCAGKARASRLHRPPAEGHGLQRYAGGACVLDRGGRAMNNRQHRVGQAARSQDVVV